jgi:dihydrodipicolinate synthase/N-acetylneuraminate lyase
MSEDRALPGELSDRLHTGCVISAHPLALDARRMLDERRQRALTRYYLASGAGGLAVAVHTTQFAIRRSRSPLLRPVLELAAETTRVEAGRPVLLVAGVCGTTEQAVAEAELAASLGYHLALLSPADLPEADEEALLARTRAVAEVLPVMGFYLQRVVGGRDLSPDYWRRLIDTPGVEAVKIAPFNRYATIDVLRAACEADRGDQVALYTGNDDNIVIDLLTSFTTSTPGGDVTRRIVGGLLGQWSVWTSRAVEVVESAHKAMAGDDLALRQLLQLAPRLTAANAALFDSANGFRGCIAGLHEVLRRQGLLEGRWCLDPDEDLSPGQAAHIDLVLAAHPELADDRFVAEHLDEWLS